MNWAEIVSIYSVACSTLPGPPATVVHRFRCRQLAEMAADSDGDDDPAENPDLADEPHY